MILKPETIFYINENAERIGANAPNNEDDLFNLGIIDSFTLVDFVTLLEDQYGISIPDSDVNPDNFRTIRLIEQYIQHRTEQK